MKELLTFTLSLLMASFLASCSKPEPQTMVTFSYDGDRFRYAFEMSGEIVNLPLEEGESGLQKFRFVVQEGEWVEFVVDEEKKSLTYRANFSETPNYRFDFAPAAGHGFYQQGDPETQYISKHLNVPKQGGTVYWR